MTPYYLALYYRGDRWIGEETPQRQQILALAQSGGQLSPHRLPTGRGPGRVNRLREGLELLQKRRRPVMHVVGRNPLSERGQPSAAFLFAHDEGPVVALPNAFHVVGVHLKCLGKLPGGPRKFAEDQHPVSVRP